MAISIIQNLTATLLTNEEKFMEYISLIVLIWGLLLLISLLQTTAPYGRYSRSGWGFLVPTKFAWVVQEFPSFAVPFMLAFYTDCAKVSNRLNLFAVGLFLLHYFQRTFLFPLLIRGGKPTPLIPFLMAIFFCGLNGYTQAGYILKYADLKWTSQTCPRIVAGTALFFVGMAINIHSDSVLRNLRKQGETGYRIPNGGMFSYVSGANFFGEIVEWWGFAVVNWTFPAFCFAVFTMCNIGPRALQHHRWYKEKFDDYPKNRKALIPFIL